MYNYKTRNNYCHARLKLKTARKCNLKQQAQIYLTLKGSAASSANNRLKKENTFSLLV